jgi:putative FmdB family regulatory protein
MPTYEFKCPQCGKVKEELRLMSKRNDEKLCDCGEKMDRLIGGGSGIIFKGTGFYETDYKRKGR